MYKGTNVNFSSFAFDSGPGLACEISDWFRNNARDHIILHVAYSVAYKGKDEKGREQMYHSAIVTHALPSSWK